MIRTITVASAFVLATSSIVHAEDRESSLLNWGYKYQNFQRVDINMSNQKYEETYSKNRRFVTNTLGSYSKHALELIGIPEQSINLMGAAVGMAINGTSLNLNKRVSLGLKLKDASDSDRTFYFGVKLKW
jgi:hypothetical protein